MVVRRASRPYPVVGLTGRIGRQLFFHNRHLRLREGLVIHSESGETIVPDADANGSYAILLGNVPQATKDADEVVAAEKDAASASEKSGGNYDSWMAATFSRLLRSESLEQPIQTIKDSSLTFTDPFDSLYRLVFQLTVRLLCCDEIADDSKRRSKMLYLYETIENSSTPTTIILPTWFPNPFQLWIGISGLRLYLMLKAAIDTKRKTPVRKRDTLELLLDENAGNEKIAMFTISRIYAGKMNSVVSVGYLLCFLSKNADWMTKVRIELHSVAAKYNQGDARKYLSVEQQLSNVPLHAWEIEFPCIDVCLRETIRMTLIGSFFRWNASTTPLPIGNSAEVVPSHTFVSYHTNEAHRNPEIYNDPDVFDPDRYSQDRAEDKKAPDAYVGWGADKAVEQRENGPHRKVQAFGLYRTVTAFWRFASLTEGHAYGKSLPDFHTSPF
ncbi:MAG: hypothetical protein Q9159_003397 [Coniocarpon cinnabarinum]